MAQQFLALKNSWDAVQRSAKRKGVVPSWRDPDLRAFVLGRGGRRLPPSTPSSGSRSSPCPSLPICNLVAQLTASHSPPAPAVSSASVTSAPAPVLSPAPAASPLPPAAPSLPDSVPSEDESAPDSAVASAVEALPDLLSDLWIPVPPRWQVLHDGPTPVLFRPDPASEGSLARVAGHHVRWGVSALSSSPGWYFRSEAPALHPPSVLPCPDWETVHSALSGLSLLAGFAPPVVTSDGPERPRRSVGLPWIEGHLGHFLQPLCGNTRKKK